MSLKCICNCGRTSLVACKKRVLKMLYGLIFFSFKGVEANCGHGKMSRSQGAMPQATAAAFVVNILSVSHTHIHMCFFAASWMKWNSVHSQP